MTPAATQSHAPCPWGNCYDQRLHEYTTRERGQHAAGFSAGKPAAASNRAAAVEVSDAMLRTRHRAAKRDRMSGNPRDLQDIHATWSGVVHYSTCTDTLFHVGQYQVEGYVPVQTNPGWTIMGNPTQSQDMQLVRDCLSGSEQAWNEFYCRYVGLVRSMVRRQLSWGEWSVDDMAQSVFTALIPALNHYDTAYSLSRFVCVIAERVCIQEYRQSKAAKRDGKTDPIDHHDSGEEGVRNVASDTVSQEQLLADGQIKTLLRRALERLGSACRRLLALRYFDELPYKEISKILGASENTLTVKTRRCLAELTAHFDEISRGGDMT